VNPAGRLDRITADENLMTQAGPSTPEALLDDEYPGTRWREEPMGVEEGSELEDRNLRSSIPESTPFPTRGRQLVEAEEMKDPHRSTTEPTLCEIHSRMRNSTRGRKTNGIVGEDSIGLTTQCPALLDQVSGDRVARYEVPPDSLNGILGNGRERIPEGTCQPTPSRLPT